MTVLPKMFHLNQIMREQADKCIPKGILHSSWHGFLNCISATKGEKIEELFKIIDLDIGCLGREFDIVVGTTRGT